MVSGSPFIACMNRLARQNGQNTAGTDTPSPTNQIIASLSNDTEATAVNDGSHTANNGPHRSACTNVLTIAERAKVVKWMRQTADDEGEKHIASKAVAHFPRLFRSSKNANIVKAMRLWKNRDDFVEINNDLQYKGMASSITRVTKNGLRRVRMKTARGRGRKRAAWVEALHRDLRSEFDRLRKLGVKFNFCTLRALATDILNNSETPEYSRNMIDPRTQKCLHQKIDARWIQTFAERFRIVSRAHTGKPRLSPEKEMEIEIAAARHLGRMKKMLTSGKFDECDIGNADETHFIINVDNGHTLGFMGDSEVKYADVVSGGEGMTMVVRLSGGRDAMIEAPFMVFTNKKRSYPIKGTPDNIAGVAYRSGPKGWMDTVVMTQWLSERRVIKKLPNNRRRVLFVDNCSGHNVTEEMITALSKINTEVRFFPPNTTHLLQPCDSFVIQKIKSAWTTKWESYKMELIRRGEWKDSSGKVANPGKTFFLRLAADSVRQVNNQRDAEGISYARKAMIITGMALNTNGQWEESQLTPALQNIINKHRGEFDNAMHSET